MEKKHFVFFCKVAELEHVTKAAEALEVSQPFVTKTISELESALGVRLFDRVGRGIRLNDMGRIYYETLRSLEQQLADAGKQLRELSEHRKKTVSVVSNVNSYIPDFLSAFKKDHPDISIYHTTASREDIFNMLAEGGVDFAVCCPLIPDNEKFHVRGTVMREERAVIICPPGHPLLEKKTVSIYDLEKYDMICSPTGYGLRDAFDVYSKAMGVYPNYVVETIDTSSIPRLVLSELGIAGIPASVAEGNKELKPFCRPLAEENIIGYIGLNWNEGRFKTEAAKTFRDYIIKYFSVVKTKRS